MLIALLLAGMAQASPPLPPPADPVLAQMAALYDEVCLKAFPADAAVATAMTAHAATELSKREVRTYLHDDPGRGWTIADGTAKFVVTLEAPPYHACGVRREMPAAFADMAAYDAVADRYRAGVAGFGAMNPVDFDVSGVHSHATAYQRVTPEGGGESLFVFTNTPGLNDKVEVRFVHQIMTPGAK